MKNVLYYNDLYDIYKDFLTIKEKRIFKLYYAEDYSLQEIALNENVTRSAIGKTIQRVEKKLENFEDKLHILKNKEEIWKLLCNYKDKEISKKVAKILKIEL